MSSRSDESPPLDPLDRAAARWSERGLPEAADADADSFAMLAAIREGLIDPSSISDAERERIIQGMPAEERARILFDANLDPTLAAALGVAESRSPTTSGDGTSLKLTQPGASLASTSVDRAVDPTRQTRSQVFTSSRLLLSAAAVLVLGVSAILVLQQPWAQPADLFAPGKAATSSQLLASKSTDPRLRPPLDVAPDILVSQQPSAQPADLFASGKEATSSQLLASMSTDPRLRPPLDVAPDFAKLDETATLGSTSTSAYITWRLMTVIVRDGDGHGSGALVGPRHILTNYHVVESAVQKAAIAGTSPRVTVILPRVEGEGARRRITRQDGEFKATVLRTAPERDLALVRLDELPAGQTELPYYQRAAELLPGSKVVVIGSAGRGLAWGYKECTARPFQSKGRRPPIGRLEAGMFYTQCEIDPGYSGGPLLEEATGKLVGITFGVPAGLGAERAALHIALEHVIEFLKPGLDSVSPAPLDAWTAGLPNDQRLGPVPQDIDGDGKVDRVVILFAQGSDANRKATARIEFIDTQERTTMRDASADSDVGMRRRLPSGLWGFATPGKFAFDAFIMAREDGVVAIGYTNDAGTVDEIRIGDRTKGQVASTVWTRSPTGLWSVSKPTGSVPLLDQKRLGTARAERIVEIWKK